MSDDQKLKATHVPWRDLWPEIIALVVAVIVPPLLLLFDLADRKHDLFQRGGLISLFVVVVLQFKALSDLNRKHIQNAVRAKSNESIQDISVTHTNLGWFTLLIAIYASAIGAFGDKFVNALLSLLYG
jgi:Na+/melibiose symporter-like transporter